MPDPREQEVIALARQLAHEGLSSCQVSARLEEAGHRPKVGERWSSVQVCRILRERTKVMCTRETKRRTERDRDPLPRHRAMPRLQRQELLSRLTPG